MYNVTPTFATLPTALCAGTVAFALMLAGVFNWYPGSASYKIKSQ